MNETAGLRIRAAVEDLASAAFRKLQAAGRDAAKGIANQWRQARGELASFKGMVAGVLAAMAVRTIATQWQEWADQLVAVARASDQLGTSVESLQAMEHAGATAGVSLEQVSKALLTLQKNAGLARSGSAAQAEQFRALGLATTSLVGDQQDAVQVFATVADKLVTIHDQGERTRLVLALFGEAGANLVPLLSKGGDAIRKMAAEQGAAGVLFRREQLGKVEAYQASLAKLRLAFDDFGKTLVEKFAPTVGILIDGLASDFTFNSAEMTAALLGVAEAMVKVTEWLVTLFGVVHKAAVGWLEIAAALSIAKEKMVGTVEGVAEAYAWFARLTKEADAIKYTAPMIENLRERIAGLQEQVRNGGAALPDWNKDKVPQAPTSSPGQSGSDTEKQASDLERFTAGARKATAAYADFGQAAFDAGQKLVTGPLDALTDTLAAGIAHTKSWGQAWKDLGRSVVGILAQVIAKLIVVKTLQLITGGSGAAVAQAKGGIMPGTVQNVRRFAQGGIVRSPTLALMGEGSAPAEAFVPLPDGRSIPVEFGGAGGAVGARAVNVHITAMDSRDVVRVLKEHRGLLRDFASDDLERRGNARKAVQGIR